MSQGLDIQNCAGVPPMSSFAAIHKKEGRKEAEVQKSVSRLKGEYIVQLFDGPLRDLPGQSKTGMTLSVTPVSRSTTTSEERRCEK